MRASVASGALTGTRVVDLSRVLAGPYCTQMLGDHGADVIKVEPITGDGTRTWGPANANGISGYYAGLNRNKSHVGVDLACAEGRAVLMRLLEDADVLVENFKPGVMDRWGLSAESLLEIFPRLVYCRVTAFGLDGPMGGLPGYDAVVQAYSGIMQLNGAAEGPPVRVPMPITDLTTGMLAFAGILLALHERQVSGRGQLVETSLLDGALSLLHPSAATYFATGEPPQRLGSAHPSIAPCNVFTTPVGDVYVAAATDQQFVVLCDFLGAPEMAVDPRFATNAARLENQTVLDAAIDELLGKLAPDTDVARDMIARGVPASILRRVDEVLEDAHLAERGMVCTLDGIRMLGVPVQLGRTPGSVRTPPRRLGVDTRAVLAAAGLTETEIDGLCARGVVVDDPTDVDR